jgi:hypothetical protein
MQKLGPGMYLDADARLHLSQGEICEHFGVPETAENIAMIERVAVQELRKAGLYSGPLVRAYDDDTEVARAGSIA